MRRVLLILAIVLLPVAVVTGQNSGQKKNVRPTASPSPIESGKPTASAPVYFYDFAKPEFLISRVHIEHDENGVGSITFEKMKLEEKFTRPLALSVETNKLLLNYWSNLGFLDSIEEYQSDREYPHLGTMKLRMQKKGKSRSSEFNWTENEDVKALTEEYKKVGYEEVWKFEIEVARKNQPLESPRIMRRIDSHLRRSEISDPHHIVPYLMELSLDERMPLIARNHARRLAEFIEKKND